ncbi:hypothetical protein J1N35_032398 [Gossypium stocksii]|uniref:Uncharacterized protein n=1 Tax=Gossypium stocksii TaxID=47602 RepID=A0A9D3V3A5_9ROSI|nr:hypothetical protein J1N35_032398 [Gossypium stocksii]
MVGSWDQELCWAISHLKGLSLCKSSDYGFNPCAKFGPRGPKVFFGFEDPWEKLAPSFRQRKEHYSFIRLR